MIYGYARVSTSLQSKDGNSLEEQELTLRNYGCQNIVTEAFTGKTMERPAFQRLLKKLQEGDTLVVTQSLTASHVRLSKACRRSRSFLNVVSKFTL